MTQDDHTGLTIRCIAGVKGVREIPNGAALLLSPVGEPSPQPTTASEVARLFKFLLQLYLEDLIYGDPCVPNLILYGERLLWTDLLDTGKASPGLRSLDVECLTRSVLGIHPDVKLDESLHKFTSDYGENPSEVTVSPVIEEVCRNGGYNF